MASLVGELMIRIPLRVRGVDLDDEATLELLGEHLSDLAWSASDGIVLAILYTAETDPVAKAVEAARRICHFLPEADVVDVDPELVSTSDIAFRLGVSREAVRLWVEGLRGPGGFPAPDGVIGNGKSKVWHWRDVHAWVRDNYRLGEDEQHLTRKQVAELDAALLRVKHPVDNEWEFASFFERRMHSHADRVQHFHELLGRLTEEVTATKAKSHMTWALVVGGDWSSWVMREMPHSDTYIEIPLISGEIEELA